jgi:hypothetical protein
MSLATQPAPAATSQPAPGTISANAMASMNLGINSFIVPFVLAIPSILFGLLALRDCRKYRMQGKGVALTGMILSVISTLSMGYVIYLAYPLIKGAMEMRQDIQQGKDPMEILGKKFGGKEFQQLQDLHKGLDEKDPRKLDEVLKGLDKGGPRKDKGS